MNAASEWIKYDPTDRSIESHVDHLVITSSGGCSVAQHAKSLVSDGYVWYGIGGYRINNVTHYAAIKLPTDTQGGGKGE
ncbi:hypothetical protein AZE31_18200 [Paenibacillus polymyxa]|nr:hypothetical protein AZE31_18200 [Paenibacillus polymyxa]